MTRRTANRPTTGRVRNGVAGSGLLVAASYAGQSQGGAGRPAPQSRTSIPNLCCARLTLRHGVAYSNGLVGRNRQGDVSLTTGSPLHARYEGWTLPCIRTAKRDEASMVPVCSSSRMPQLDDLSDQPCTRCGGGRHVACAVVHPSVTGRACGSVDTRVLQHPHLPLGG